MNTLNRKFYCLQILSMLFLTVMIADCVTVYKLVSMPFAYTSACAYVFPFWFVLSDIITEIYGVEISRRTLISAFVCEMIFSLGCFILVKLKSPAFWHDQYSFDLVLGGLPRISLSSSLAVLISGYFNIYFLSKWKILMKGKYFWLRSIGASWIGEGLYTTISIFFMMYGMLSIKGIFIAIFWSYLMKIICTIFLAFPANIAVFFLKKYTHIDESPDKINFREVL